MIRCHKLFVYLGTGLLLTSLAFAGPELKAENLTIILDAQKYQIVDKDNGEQIIKMEDFGYLLVPGKPMLPAKCFMIAIPPGAEVVSVTTDVPALEEIQGRYQIKPAPPVLPSEDREEMVKECRLKWQHNYDATYSSDDAYPQAGGRYLGTGGLRKYNFVRVVYFPFSYHPQTGRLIFRPSLTVSIDYTLPLSVDQKYEKSMSDTKGDRLASRLLVNYPQAKEWYRPHQTPKFPQQTYDYVIITTDALTTAVSPLVTWKETIGYSVNVVTTSWIDGNYTGSDLQEKIRNFLIDKYMEWGIEYVLLVGDIDVLPMRHCYPDPSNHDPNSSYCPPTDYYYADLTGDWDSDGDGYHGEYEEDDVDFIPEVYVGRIPHSDETTVTSICQKLVTFEGDSSPWKDNALLLGAMSNYANEDFSGGDRTDGASLMENMISDMLTGWSYTTMYEKEGLDPCAYACDFPLSHTNVINNWSANDYGIVNWWAHGGSDGAWRKWWGWDDGDGVPENDDPNEMYWEAFISNPDVSSLDDGHPSLIFSCSCNNGWPEVDNLAKRLLEHGSAGMVASTRVSFYNDGWEDELSGGNASIDYFFFYYMIVEGERVGDALFSSKVYYLNNFFWWGWSSQQNMFDFCLYGDPALVREGGVLAAPHISSTSPGQNELNVPINTNISVTFDIDMDETTINDSTFVVNAWSTGLHQGTIAYNSLTKTATLDPDSNFAVGEIVTVVLTTDIQSSEGVPMESSYVWSFSTEVSDESPGTFSPPTNWEAGDVPLSVFCADLDGDSDLDLAVANRDGDNVSILKNNGDGAFETRVDYTTGDSPVSVFCADLDGEGDLDLAVANANSDNISILMNNGDGTFQTAVNYEAGYGPWYVFCADLDGDTHLDLAVINSGTEVSIFKNNGDGTFQTKVDYSTGSSPNCVFCADLDGDYDLDLAVPNSYIDSISILKNNGDGTFQSKVDYAAGNGPLHVFCADLDGDTDLDLAVPNGFSDDVSILKNNGDGTFETKVDYITGDYPVSVFCADLDGDTHLDLAVTNYAGADVSILKNNGDGTFQAKVDYAAGDGPSSVFCADLDGDSDLDLAVANFGSDSVSILFNCLPSGDCNGDGVVGPGDVVYLLNYLFRNDPPPDPYKAGDVNCDGVVGPADVVYMINYFFRNGPPPTCC